MHKKLDIDFVRQQFPAMSHPETGRVAFFENAGGFYVPGQVIDELNDLFVSCKVQPYGFSDPSRKAGQAMDRGYETVAGLLNSAVENITLGPSTTMNLYVLAQALRPNLDVGDEIVVTNQDHEANIGCWRKLSEFGVRIREWRVDPVTGELHLDALLPLLNENTRLVCVSLCSNIVGSINPITEISRLAHDVGALVIGDGVSLAPHDVMDTTRLGVDFLVYSTYKTFATHLGVLWGSDSALAGLEPQGHFFNEEKPHYRMNPTGPLHAEIGALGGLRRYLDAVDSAHFDTPEANPHLRAARVYSLFKDHETELAAPLLAFLDAHSRVRLIGQSEIKSGQRAPTISFTVKDLAATEIAKTLGQQGIGVGAGHFYALRCLQGLGIEPEHGVVRASLVHYNSAEEVSRLISALDAMLR